MISVGLIEPSLEMVGGVDTKTPHLGLLYIASALLKEGFKVEVLDIKVAAEKEIDDFFNKKFDVVGLSITSASFNRALLIIKKLKRSNPSVVIVVGGPHVSVSGTDVLEYDDINYAVFGEGEVTVVELLKQLDKNLKPGAKELGAINGVIFRADNMVHMNAPRELIRDVDSIALPAFNLIPLERYNSYCIITSRGCPFKCTYCSTPVIWGGKWRARSPDNIMEEIELLAHKADGKVIYINDDNFTLDTKRAALICDKIISRDLNLRFSSMGIRADRVDLSLLRKMYKAGIVSLSIGVESANAQVLASINKGETLEDIRRGLALAKRAGMRVIGLFMIGNPGDTLSTVKETINFVLEEDFDEVIFALALPYPGTGLWDYVRAKGRWIGECNYINFSHFANEPVFETPDFPFSDRIKAYELSQQCVIKVRSKKYLASIFTARFLKKVFSRRIFSRESITRFTGFVKIYFCYERPKS